MQLNYFILFKPAIWRGANRKHDRGLSPRMIAPFFYSHTITSWQEPSPADPTVTDIVAELMVQENVVVEVVMSWMNGYGGLY